MEESKLPISLDGYFYALEEGGDAGVPAVFLDDTKGSEAVLIFSSKDLAKKYCYLTRPKAINSIYQLDRKTVEDSSGNKTMMQSGLIKIARSIKKHRLDHITDFVFDHPGTIGTASYVSVDDIANYGRKPVPANIATVNELEAFISKEMED